MQFKSTISEQRHRFKENTLPLRVVNTKWRCGLLVPVSQSRPHRALSLALLRHFLAPAATRKGGLFQIALMRSTGVSSVRCEELQRQVDRVEGKALLAFHCVFVRGGLRGKCNITIISQQVRKSVFCAEPPTLPSESPAQQDGAWLGSSSAPSADRKQWRKKVSEHTYMYRSIENYLRFRERQQA